METLPESFPIHPKDSDGKLLAVGDRVVIQSVASCITELPTEDRERLLRLVGETRSVVQIDRFGFVWLSFAALERSADFCLIPREVRRA
jgi:hypothetical protein